MRIRALALACICALLLGATAMAQQPEPAKLPVAAILASWFPGSHPDVILGRIIKTSTLDDQGIPSRLRLASMYIDRPQQGDISQQLADQYDIRMSASIEDALTLGTGKLAVGGVVLCTEWADYPISPLGQIMYPHRQMFDEIVAVFKATGAVVPVFVDKHLADTWEDSLHIVETARALGIPLMAGSSVPGAWRKPAVDVTPQARLQEIVGISYHTLDCYGFHGLEMLQTIAEQRRGGETGVASVQCLTGAAVWEAAGTVYDTELLVQALARHEPPLTLEEVQQRVAEPVLFITTYSDGLRTMLFTLNYAVLHWAAAWRYQNGQRDSALFWLDETKKMLHFALQMNGVETMFLTGRPSWPVERTLITSGVLDAALQSKAAGGQIIDTPQMQTRDVQYQAYWRWAPMPLPLPVQP